MVIFLLPFFLFLMLVFTAGCGEQAPVIDWVRATPDSVPQSGVAYLRVQAKDPGRGELSFRWEAAHGTVAPDTADSAVYFAPPANIDDTVIVLASNRRGLATSGSTVIHVREGLCGGRPEFLITTGANLLVADSARVFFVEPVGERREIRRMAVDGFERDTVATRPHEIRRLAHSGDMLYWLERDVSGAEPYLQLMAAGKTDSAPPTLIRRFSGRYEPAIDIAAGTDQVHVAWLETVADTTYVARITSYPRRGGTGQERFSLVGPTSEGTIVSRLVAAGDELFFLVISRDPDRVAVMKLPSSGEAVRLVGPDLLAPGTLSSDDHIAVADDQVFWSERLQGRIGRVGRDGTGAEFVLPAGGDAQGVNLLAAAAGPAGAGPRLFWTVPGDLRGMVVSTRTTIRNLDRGTGDIRAMASNQRYLFYLQENGTGRMFRLLMP